MFFLELDGLGERRHARTCYHDTLLDLLWWKENVFGDKRVPMAPVGVGKFNVTATAQVHSVTELSGYIRGGR